MRLDLELWVKFLSSPQSLHRPFIDLTEKIQAEQLDWATDASRNNNLGAGGYCNHEWFWLKWPKDMIVKIEPSIAYLELYALTVSIMLWLKNFKGRRIIVLCDNQSVVYMINKNTSHCKHCLKLIRMIVLESMTCNARVFAKYVNTKQNYYADLLSRNKIQKFKNIALLNEKPFNEHETPIPDELWPISKIW